ncbi:DUF6318 family protein [Aquipuribacter hungaricus]|uniref:DUF6318 family protein n=1 Tax=Aquipuribacter hungaricus TaxID=545624 RepID=A0ABV7WGJ1_9MICO
MVGEGRDAVRLGRAWAPAIVVLLAVGTGACTQGEPGDDVTAPVFESASPQPSSEPSSGSSASGPSSGPSSSAEPSGGAGLPSDGPVTAPVLPELATQQTPEGAVAFTQWWFDTLNYATATGDTAGLRAASDPGCGTCQNYIEEIDAAYGAGGAIEGGLFTVRVDPAGAIQDLGVRLAVYADSQAMQVFDDQGAVTGSFEPDSAVITFTALLDPAGWRAGGLAS